MFWVPGNALRTKTCSDATFAGSSHAATWPAASKLSGSRRGGFGAEAQSESNEREGEVGDAR